MSENEEAALNTAAGTVCYYDATVTGMDEGQTTTDYATFTVTNGFSDFVLMMANTRQLEDSHTVNGGFALSYALISDTNGGSAITAVTKTSGTTVDLTAYAPAENGYAFDGWYSGSALTTRVTSIKLMGNTTVYAKWVAKSTNPFTDVDAGAY